jgi:hypothetical protein
MTAAADTSALRVRLAWTAASPRGASGSNICRSSANDPAVDFYQSTCLGLYRANFYVEMMCGFHRAKRTIERGSGTILQVRLHEDHIGALARGDPSHALISPVATPLRR